MFGCLLLPFRVAGWVVTRHGWDRDPLGDVEPRTGSSRGHSERSPPGPPGPPAGPLPARAPLGTTPDRPQIHEARRELREGLTPGTHLPRKSEVRETIRLPEGPQFAWARPWVVNLGSGKL
jgi:hypothetical protein